MPLASLLSFSPDHIHPILVNFSAALVPTSVASDIAGRAIKKQSLHDAAFWTLILAAAITPFTALAGLWWKKSVAAALPPSTLITHQWLGISLALLFLILAIWRWSIQKRDTVPGNPYLVFALAVVLALIYQGGLGGEMVFG
jgi:uncharacterized membrane protein